MKTLLDLYTSRLEDLIALSKSIPDEDCDGPFLMAEPAIAFTESPNRILFVGQETNGWHGSFQTSDEGDITEYVENYRKFNFGEKYRSSPFFQYYQSTGDALAGSTEACMWTNLFKFGRDSGKGTPSEKVNEAELQYFNILREEIEILSPSCVLFLTGPNYDHFLQQRIPDAEFHPMGQFDIRQLAKISSSALPESSYRIYHPGYGNRDTEMYHGTIDLVKEDYFSRHSK